MTHEGPHRKSKSRCMILADAVNNLRSDRTAADKQNMISGFKEVLLSPHSGIKPVKNRHLAYGEADR